MKKDIHPVSNLVVFKDGANGAMFLTRSTLTSKEVIKYSDNKEYPLITVEISSKSHPFYTGQQKFVDGS
ncbi:type B 50S ribosomal protein L31, partial [Borrelia crocidurae]|uniref:type B 50S ribosomal protein L31 n=1 Tax=Borrelia crocidurae TaxID=29520 RepID=UPI0005907CD7